MGPGGVEFELSLRSFRKHRLLLVSQNLLTVRQHVLRLAPRRLDVRQVSGRSVDGQRAVARRVEDGGALPARGGWRGVVGWWEGMVGE